MRGQDCDSSRMRPVYLDGPAREFPNLNFHIAHLGVPWHDEAAMMVRMLPNVTADITGRVWRDQKGVDWFRNLLWFEDAWDKILFGTDCTRGVEEFEPQYNKQLYIVEGLGLDEATQRKFFGDNAARLLKLQDATALPARSVSAPRREAGRSPRG